MTATTEMLLITKICFQFFVKYIYVATHFNIFEYPCNIGKYSRNDKFLLTIFKTCYKMQSGQAIM